MGTKKGHQSRLTLKTSSKEGSQLLTSSLRTPKIFVKEFGDFLMSCHQHGLCVNLLVHRLFHLYGCDGLC